MYSVDTASLQQLRGRRWSGLAPNVYFLGLTSLLTDISSEMVTAVLPLYLVFALHLTPLQVGLVDAVVQGATTLARLAGGWFADRWQRHRDVAAFGYAASAVCKLGLVAAGSSWGALSAVLALDRMGKGLRTAPRDALISQACEPSRVGLAFGVHRAFDTAGALIGPLAAFALLALAPEGYHLVFVTSFFIACAGVAALVLLVPGAKAAGAGTTARPSWPQATALLRDARLKRVLIGAAVLGVATVADPFFYLLLQRNAQLSARWFPLLFLGTAIAYLLLAVPAGRLADRIGRARVFLLGHALLLAACLALLLASTHLAFGALALALLGGYYACTDGVLMATVSGWLPAGLRASGMAMVTTATGLSRLAGSVLFGVLWNAWSLEAAVGVFAVALLAAVIVTAPIWFKLQRHCCPAE
jgi:MFS family permease